MRRRSTILVVDDDPNILKSLKRLFIDDSISMLVAANARQALSLLENNAVDLVLSDEKMPGMSGVEFLKEVRGQYPSTIRIILTGNAELDMAIKAVNEGEVYRFLTKPWNSEKLRTLVLKALKYAEFEREETGLLQKKKRRLEAIDRLEENHPGITDVARDEKGAVIIPEVEES